MLNYLKADWLKQKNSFNKLLIWLAPTLTILLALVLMFGNYLQSGAYNWWYVMLLPATFTMFTSFTVTREKKKHYHGLLAVSTDKNKLWISQMILLILFLFVTCFIFFLMVTLGGLIFGQMISIYASFFATIVLVITFAWQIPLWMFVSIKFGAFISIGMSLILNFGLGIFYATESFWWVPFSIPSRLMCPIIGVLPNGLLVEPNSLMADRSVIFPGLIITISLFLVSSALTTLWFKRYEV